MSNKTFQFRLLPRWRFGVASGLALTLAVLVTQAASADMVLPLTSTVINAGGATVSTENYEVVDISSATPPTISPTVTYDIGNTFNQSGSTSTINAFGASATGPGGPWNFQDNFAFTTTGATIHGTEIAFQTDATNLQVRLISATDVNGHPVPVTTNSNAAGQELVNGPSVVSVINGWTTYPTGAIDFTVLMPAAVSAGNYILQVRGDASTPGSWGGTVTFDAVPLPAALPLLLSGLGGLGFFGGARGLRRRVAV
jgi:hypothetical protein